MAKKSTKTEAQTPIDLSNLTPQRLAQAVFEGLGPRVRQEMTLEEIKAVADKLPYKDKRPSRSVPVLMVKRLLFKGTKTLSGHAPMPIDYEQAFAPGVNIILIERNLVGKSSILKTIKFALTGDHEEYDQAVREWIKEIWLLFALGTRNFTIVLAEREDAWHGALVSGQESRPLEQVIEDLPRKDHHWVSLDRIREGLAEFFFREYSLASLGWTQSMRDGDVVSRTASWQTYFQALRIRDDDHKFLLCEPIPGLGNQELILFTAFLGLHLAEPLNQLGVEQSTLRKVKQRNDAEVEKLGQEKERLLGECRAHSERLAAVQRVQAERHQAVIAGDVPGQIVSLDDQQVQTATEISGLLREQQDLASKAQWERAQAKRLRNLAELQREFTGLDVTLCPRCSKEIDQAFVDRETQTHECRLCSKTTDAAAPEDVEHFEVEAKECEARALVHQRGQAEIGRRITALRETERRTRDQATALRQSIQAGLSAALPRPEEEEEKRHLSESIGKINHQVWLIDQQLGQSGGDGTDPEKQAKIVKRVRDVLQEEAERRNNAINTRLNELANGVIAALGADQITGVSCSALGGISLRKNDVEVTFGGIKNPGERFRVKLALFLAMMQLGRQGGFGRHPGFLLIDQLGAAEMVPDNLRASAETFRRIDTDFGKQVQLICCTAKPEFRDATDSGKIYGHKVEGPNGELWAF